jgi:cytochrome c peroxidase
VVILAIAFELGRQLFYERRLSYDGKIACGDCHQQRYAFTDAMPSHIPGLKNTPTLTNIGHSSVVLEKQAFTPMFNEHPVELGMKGHEKEILARLRPDYGSLTISQITHALAAFERTLISNRSPYDRLVWDDDQKALSAQAWRGMRTFFTAGCASCHAGTDFASKGVPTLRNVALTAPYMHDGSVATLREVLDRHSALSVDQKLDVLEFLDALTDREFVTNPRFGPLDGPSSALRAPSPRFAGRRP